MNAAHLHLMTNHLSIVGLGFAILLNLFALFRKSDELLKASCWFFALVALLSLFAIATGDGAGEIVRTYPGISNDAIELHESWAYLFFYGLIIVGIADLVGLWLWRKKPALLKKINVIALIFSVLLLFLAYQAGSTGGKISHPEIEKGALSGKSEK